MISTLSGLFFGYIYYADVTFDSIEFVCYATILIPNPAYNPNPALPPQGFNFTVRLRNPNLFGVTGFWQVVILESLTIPTSVSGGRQTFSNLGQVPVNTTLYLPGLGTANAIFPFIGNFQFDENGNQTINSITFMEIYSMWFSETSRQTTVQVNMALGFDQNSQISRSFNLIIPTIRAC